jgi:hypothetical protein
MGRACPGAAEDRAGAIHTSPRAWAFPSSPKTSGSPVGARFPAIADVIEECEGLRAGLNQRSQMNSAFIDEGLRITPEFAQMSDVSFHDSFIVLNGRSGYL